MENQLLKQLYSTTSKLVNDQVQRDIENFEKADKIIIWIVGFSIGIFMLILTRKSENPIFLELEFELTIIALITVVLGLLFRIFSFFTQMRLNSIVFDFVSFSTGYTNASKIPIPKTITEVDSLDNIIIFLEEDFGIKTQRIDTSNFSGEKLAEYRILYKNYYESLASSNNIEEQMKEFSTQLAFRFGLNPENVMNSSQDDSSLKSKGKGYRVLLRISYWLFFLTIINFIVGIGIVAFKLIENNCS
ncbi:hypothetical protein [Aquimarina sediminis]|uniref:hypothetical protein n=1 Tax=Aquimarina sediminis TaxID=2070536 RepID=UPI000CA033C6|nr:hypothetical protein [Aquimarina sediminis]